MSNRRYVQTYWWSDTIQWKHESYIWYIWTRRYSLRMTPDYSILLRDLTWFFTGKGLTVTVVWHIFLTSNRSRALLEVHQEVHSWFTYPHMYPRRSLPSQVQSEFCLKVSGVLYCIQYTKNAKIYQLIVPHELICKIHALGVTPIQGESHYRQLPSALLFESSFASVHNFFVLFFFQLGFFWTVTLTFIHFWRTTDSVKRCTIDKKLLSIINKNPNW